MLRQHIVNEEIKMKDELIPSPWQINRNAALELLKALEAALEWIDAVPPETALPAMPGFDRDWVNGIIKKARGESCADNT